MKLIIFGPPLAGKGTQAEKISKKHGIPHISAGDILRNSVEAGTTIGMVISDFMNQGKLVPDGIIIKLIQDRIKVDDCKPGFILDGFPRTLYQAEVFHEKENIDRVLNIVVEDEVLKDRIQGRRTCMECRAIFHIISHPPKERNKCDRCGGKLIQRGDDRVDILENRLLVYHKETKPLIDFYEEKGKIVDIDGNQDIHEIHDAIEEKLKDIS